jgi:Pentapeptide repeats (8 copies)
MLLQVPRHRPRSWSEVRQNTRFGWLLIFKKLDWYCAWAAWALGNWAFLEILESLGAFSVLIAVIFYFGDSGNRIKQKHYQAWQVINTAQGKGGSGGRIEALQELNKDNVPLIGVNADGAFLKGVNLRGARMSRCSLQSGDLRDSNLDSADMTFCNLRGANFRDSSLERTALVDADMEDADLTGSNLTGADLTRTDLSRADLRDTNLAQVKWKQIASLQLANIRGARNPPEGFLAFAMSHGAVSMVSDEDWDKAQEAKR